MTAHSLNLLDQLDAHRVAFSARLDALPEGLVHTQPEPGVWSLAQVAEHMLRVDKALRADGLALSATRRAVSRVTSAGLRAGLALPVRIKAPPGAQAVMPSAAPQWLDVREAWADLRASWRTWTPAPNAVAFPHPFAGPLVWNDALGFLLAHHRHHDGQVKRILAALA